MAWMMAVPSSSTTTPTSNGCPDVSGPTNIVTRGRPSGRPASGVGVRATCRRQGHRACGRPLRCPLRDATGPRSDRQHMLTIRGRARSGGRSSTRAPAALTGTRADRARVALHTGYAPSLPGGHRAIPTGLGVRYYLPSPGRPAFWKSVLSRRSPSRSPIPATALVRLLTSCWPRPGDRGSALASPTGSSGPSRVIVREMTKGLHWPKSVLRSRPTCGRGRANGRRPGDDRNKSGRPRRASKARPMDEEEGSGARASGSVVEPLVASGHARTRGSGGVPGQSIFDGSAMTQIGIPEGVGPCQGRRGRVRWFLPARGACGLVLSGASRWALLGEG
jgi:hypothetical protein